jgi:hypothetical protein
MKESETKVKDYQRQLENMKTELDKSKNLVTKVIQEQVDKEK